MKLFKRKRKTFKLPKLNVPDKYQPYEGVSLDRNHPERRGG